MKQQVQFLFFRKFFLTGCLFLFSLMGWGQISITTASLNYDQNFNSLLSTGLTNSNSTIPAGWFFAETGSGANNTYATTDGTLNSGNTYSFGTTGNSERSLGTIQSGSVVSTIGCSFSNSTGSSISNLIISYIGEQWRLGSTGRNDRLDFQYSLDATSLTTGTWIDVDLLDFIAPISTGTTGALNGNSASNKVSIKNIISGLTITNGSNFWIRWTDFGALGSDDGLAIDDFKIEVPNTWTGNSSSSWNTASNWSLNAVPTSSDSIIISSNGSNAPIIDTNVTIGAEKSLTISGTSTTLSIAPGKVLTIAGTADFGGKLVTFKSDNTGSAMLGTVTGSLTGATNVKVERYIPQGKRAFRF